METVQMYQIVMIKEGWLTDNSRFNARTTTWRDGNIGQVIEVREDDVKIKDLVGRNTLIISKKHIEPVRI